MYISKIKIKNYRLLIDAELEVDAKTTLIVGRNNTAKTSCLACIENVLNGHPFSFDDYPLVKRKTLYEIIASFMAKEISFESLCEQLEPISIEFFVDYSLEDLEDNLGALSPFIIDVDVDTTTALIRVEFRLKPDEKVIWRTLEESYYPNGVFVPSDEARDVISTNFSKLFELVIYAVNPKNPKETQIKKHKELEELFPFHIIPAERLLGEDGTQNSSLSSLISEFFEMNEEELDPSVAEKVKELRAIVEKANKNVQKQSDSILSSLVNDSVGFGYPNGEELQLGVTTQLSIDDQIKNQTQLSYTAGTSNECLPGTYNGLGYKNLIKMEFLLAAFAKKIEKCGNACIPLLFIEEPESHMHPQMQQVFIKYLLDYYESKLQGLITTHSNEMVRVAGISHLRVIRHVGNFKSELYDLSILVKDLKKSEEMEDKELANFFDWFFEIGYSEIVFADRAIFYEGDTERLYIRKVMTLEKYKKLKQQYVAFIQVGGAYAKNYEKLIKLLGIKSLIITDIDYGKSEIVIEDVKKSKTTNATIEYFYSINNSTDTPTVEELYSWKETGGNIIEDLIYVCFQTKDDGYARTLEEAMINKYFDMDVSKCYKKSDWKEKRKDSELKFSIPRMKNKKEIADDDMVSVRDILAATSGNKTDFMCSVIMKDYVKKMLPDYIERGLEWLMK